jgi:hypothetical protein
MNLWDALEKRLENKFGRPDDKIAGFLRDVENSSEYWEMVESNS